ncbi:MAG: Gfo/Idh/MocA family protein, partial [Acidimicrobiia bacterium]
MNLLNVGVIGTGWCGGIRAITCANSALVGDLQIAEVNEDRLAEMKSLTNPSVATADWEALIDADLDALLVCATPETSHYPMAKAALEAGKHVLLEKPMAITMDEADDLID